MTRDSKRLASRVSRRKFLVSTGVVGATGLAGCTGNSNDGGDDPGTDDPGGTGDPASDPSVDTSLLTAEGSSTVYPISNTGSSYWSGNAPPSDGEYWGHNEEEGTKVPGWDEIQTDMNLADYFASKYGFEPTGERSNPPFRTSVSLSHSGTGCKAVTNELVDIGNSSGPITAELGWSDQKADETVVDHVVGRDGQPVVVSKDVWDAGVQQLTGDEIRQIYQNEVTNWSEIGGPDKEIFCIGRAVGSGTDTSFRLNMLGGKDADMSGVDTREGQNQGVAELVTQNEGAIAYMALAFTGPEVKPVAINFDGTVYKPDKDAEHTIFDRDYPLNRDLHMYTKVTEDTPEGTDMREAAFVNMFLTEFGQARFVEANNYIPLPTKDIQSEKDKLPDQV